MYYIASFLVALIALVGTLYFVSRRKVEKKKNQEETKLKSEFSHLIKSATTRDEIEIVVWKAKKYKRVIPITSSYEALKKTLKKYNIKKIEC